ncbi:MAG: putative membrane protein YkgB [Saprospiraceae bacterium]|jgi:uncharacterized membrane protein YkgB
MSNFSNRRFQKKLNILTISIGLIYFYFGLLKFFPSISPAESIGISTVCKLCFGLLSPKVSIFLLALLEVSIGICLITRIYLKVAVTIAIIHLTMTFTPFLLFPEQAFQGSLISPSLLGQYIFKNIIIISALLVIYPGKNDSVALDGSN